MRTGLFTQQFGSSRLFGHVPRKQDDMNFQRFQFLHQHFVVGVACDQHHEIEVAEQREFVSFQGEPDIHTFLDDGDIAVLLNLAQVFVMENHVVFYQSIFKLAFLEQQVFAVRVVHPVSAPEIMAFGDVTVAQIQLIPAGDFRADELEQWFYLDIEGQVVLECFIDFREIAPSMKMPMDLFSVFIAIKI